MKRIAFSSLLLSLLFVSLVTKAQSNTTRPLKVRINHIAVYVFDLEKSRHFYEDVVQLTWIKNPFNDSLHEWFSIGDGAQLHIIKGSKEITEHIKNSHICFSVASIDDFVVNLKKHDVGFINWNGDTNAITTRVDGIKQIYFKDPDGYWVEVNTDYKE